MRIASLFISLVVLVCSCGPSDTWYYGDIELGDEYYYMVEPAFNAIQTLNTTDPSRSNGYVLREINSIGFNENFIYASNRKDDETEYWIIDKERKSGLYLDWEKAGKTQEELIGPIDSVDFFEFAKKQKITFKSATDYQVEAGWTKKN